MTLSYHTPWEELSSLILYYSWENGNQMGKKKNIYVPKGTAGIVETLIITADTYRAGPSTEWGPLQAFTSELIKWTVALLGLILQTLRWLSLYTPKSGVRRDRVEKGQEL